LTPPKPSLVGLAELEPALHAAAGHQDGEAVRVVVASEDLTLRGAAFAEGRASELAAPDDEGVVEESALLEVVDERGDRLVGARHLRVRPSRMSSRGPVPWKSQPQSKSCTKRTPCSTRRRREQAVVREAGFAPGGAP
jgi:hypothetical protein